MEENITTNEEQVEEQTTEVVDEQQQSGGGETPAQTPQAVEPQQPQFNLSELNFLRNQVSTLAQELENARKNLREYELADLGPEERRMKELEYQQQQFEQQRKAWEDQIFMRQWYEYYQAYVPAGVIQGDNPVDWQHAVITHLHGENKKLQQQIEALKKAATKQPQAPKVTAHGGAPAHKKSVWDLTPEERQQLRQRAMWGQISAEDYPTI